MIGLSQTPADLIERCKQLAAVGVQHAIFNMPLDYTIAPLETIGRVVIPAIREL